MKTVCIRTALLPIAGAVLFSCTPAKPPTPPLTEGTAITLLQMTPKSRDWLDRVRRDDPVCGYKIELPDQSSHPKVIDVEQVITCGKTPAPRALNATVTFTYDEAAGHWVISRFAS